MFKRKSAVVTICSSLLVAVSLSWAQMASHKSGQSHSSRQKKFVNAQSSSDFTQQNAVDGLSIPSKFGLGSQSRIHINGFLSAGIAWTNTSANYTVPNHGIIDNSVGAAPLSLIGLQFTADLLNHLQVITQFVGDGDNTNGNTAYRVNVEWAFLRYVFNDNYQIQAGRFRLPAFLYSQTQQVGFSYPWVILPNEVYRIVPFNNVNGITLITRHPLGNTDWNITFQPYYGSNRSQFTVYNSGNPEGIDLHFRENNLAGIVVSVGNQNLMLRGSYATLKLTGIFNNGVSPVVPSRTLFSSDSTKFYSFAAKLLLGRWIFIGEYADRDTPPSVAALAGYYGALGFKFGKLTPLFTYARIKTTNESKLALAPAFGELPQDQQSSTLSLDYLLSPNVDIKASISQISPLNGTFGLFNSDPGKRQVYLYGLSVNAVF